MIACALAHVKLGGAQKGSLRVANFRKRRDAGDAPLSLLATRLWRDLGSMTLREGWRTQIKLYDAPKSVFRKVVALDGGPMSVPRRVCSFRKRVGCRR